MPPNNCSVAIEEPMLDTGCSITHTGCWFKKLLQVAGSNNHCLGIGLNGYWKRKDLFAQHPVSRNQHPVSVVMDFMKIEMPLYFY
jgi:hypothetical protein